ncbi:methyl-accepting chemotaxis protein [Flexithrix dorotheae]|uniref:methyl-accepting chemotaxis protein n=1 Tax=Flexithrix dorotheae TaxID=70993 RepID=UPI00037D03A2|nr:methyl-accepting chemotaxis protein [Flexithrix dorotheae]
MKLFELTTNQRIVIIFLFVIFISISGAIYNSLQTQELKGEIEKIYNDNLLSIDYLIEADRDAYQSSILISQALSDIVKEDSAKLSSMFIDIKDNLAQVSERYNKFFNISAFTKLKEFDKYDTYDKTFREKHGELTVVTNEIVSLLSAGNFDKAEALYYTSYASAFEPMRDAMDKYTDLSLGSADEAYHSSMELSEGIFRNSMVIVLLVFISIVAGGLYLKRSISIPLKEAMAIVDKISAGDLRVKIQREKYNRKDQIGFLLLKIDDMAKNQRKIIWTVKSGADYINKASVELSSSAGQLSQGASLQASSVEEVSSSMEEMAANIQQNTDNAKETERIALNSNKQVETSNKSVEETVDSMSTIVRKNSIIGEIARQTNLLALNAAVEAARAGEHGKGFAVVASEIRKLAERSQTAAKEIDEISNSSEKVARTAGEMLNKLVPEIEKTSNLVAEISAASIEQNDGANQINIAIQQLNTVVQQNAASAEELASNSEELNSQAEILRKAISFFKLNEDEYNNESNLNAFQSMNSFTSRQNFNTQPPQQNSGIESKSNGFDLILDQNKDNLDGEFEKF